jgi:hypothetical protein
MKVPTIAAVIAEEGPEQFGFENYKAAVAFLKAGGARWVERQQVVAPPPYNPDEEIDLSLIIDPQQA